VDSPERNEESEGPVDDIEGIVDPLAPKAGSPGAYDPADPMAAIRMAQEAIANSPLGSGPLSEMGFGKNIQEQLAQAAAQLQANDQALAQFGGIAGVAAAGGAMGAASSPAAGSDPIALIERLAALRESGALTDEEFETQKRRILGDG
jgi:hypothetical protein